MEDSWINPFRPDPDSLANLSTAALAEVDRDIMNASKNYWEVHTR